MKDIVIWDSHPLSLGATPQQVYIDGIPQLKNPSVSTKPDTFQSYPRPPNFDKEARETVEWEGLPPLKLSLNSRKGGRVGFLNVRSVWGRNEKGVVEMMSVSSEGAADAKKVGGEVVVESGRIICYAPWTGSCIDSPSTPGLSFDEIVDLEGGSISPAFISFGSTLGLNEILLERVTNDGSVYDPLMSPGGVPEVLGGRMVRALDGLQFGGRNTLYVDSSAFPSSFLHPRSLLPFFILVDDFLSSFLLSSFLRPSVPLLPFLRPSSRYFEMRLTQRILG